MHGLTTVCLCVYLIHKNAGCCLTSKLSNDSANQDVLFNFHADITGIGGLPISM